MVPNCPTAGNSNSQSQQPMNGNQLPPMWSSFLWNATGSYSASGTISNQIIYPSPPAPLMNPTGPLFMSIDVNNSAIKLNFTVGGMQKTNTSGTWLTFAPGGQCWFIPYWTYAVQIQAYTFATLKHVFNSDGNFNGNDGGNGNFNGNDGGNNGNFNGNDGGPIGLFTGNIEDVSSCATTVATALLTQNNRVIEWDFQGGFLTNLGSTNFDYQLLFTSFGNVVPQSNTAYWDVDASCYPPNYVSKTFCSDVFPFGCSSFLSGYKPEGNATPSC